MKWEDLPRNSLNYAKLASTSKRKYFKLTHLPFEFRSKKQFIWRLMLDDKEYNVELFSSKVSGKKKLLLNGSNLYEVKK